MEEDTAIVTAVEKIATPQKVSNDEAHPDAHAEEANSRDHSVTAISEKEEEFTIFHCINYLGAAMIDEPCNEGEIQKIMSFLNENSSDSMMQVCVSVPLHSNGYVIIYDETQQEISRFGINQIIFFCRGTGQDVSLFGFTCSHGASPASAIFQCHSFLCQNSAAVARIFQCFGKAFVSPIGQSAPAENQVVESNNPQETRIFEVSLEIREDDGKGNYNAVPRDKGYFKLRSNIGKQMVLTVQQINDVSKELIIERCFGLLLSPGRKVRHSDFQLIEMVSWSIGSGQDRKSYAITGQWDSGDPAFESLNQETAKDSYVFLTVAIDLVMKGIREPIRFALETKAKVYPTSERFWMLGRKHHFTQQFALSLKENQVCQTTLLGEVDKNKTGLPALSFTSFIRSSSIASIEIDTPTNDDEESDNDEPLQSGMGEISKHCTDEQIAAWSEIVASWPPESISRPKHLSALVRAGIPDTIRGEMWLRLSGCQNDLEMMNIYRTLLSKECPNEDVILRDITRTFPANDYFKESGTGQEQLLRISKGYAVYDIEFGYCQGISFIGAALLLQLPEEQSFCLLVKIMYVYGFREFYRDGFLILHKKLYQLDRLIEEQIPPIWAHFQELGIESHMYASQWFLTLFTAKFPLVFVFKVIDLFLLEGSKILFQFAVSLLAASRKDLLVLDFEGVLKYFRVSLPKKYRSADAANALVRVALQVKCKRLKKYEAEFLAIKEHEKNYVDPLTRLTMENKKLMEDVIRSDYIISSLVLSKSNAEETCINLEDELNRTKISLKETEETNSRLKEETDSVKELFQKEVKQYDTESEKKSNIIAEYKRICSQLSTQLEEELKVSKERMSFFKSNLCQTCSAFVSTAINIVNTSSDEQFGASKDNAKGVKTPTGAESLDHVQLQPLENELAKTKIALAEAECRNDDISHQLAVALSELESYRSNHSGGGSAWLWKNLSFNKDSKKMGVVHHTAEDAGGNSLPTILPSSTTNSHSNNPHNLKK